MNTPTIKTNNLILRKFTNNDLDALFDILSDDKTNEFLPWFKINSLKEAKDFLDERFIKYYDYEFALRYAVCLKDNNIPIGYVWLSNDDNHDLGYALKSEYWHKGIMTEATTAVVAQITKSKLLYITATHDINNPASGKILQKIGMKYQYSYVEKWQPKNIEVTFRMYQLNFDKNDPFVYEKYKEKYPNNFVEDITNINKDEGKAI